MNNLNLIRTCLLSMSMVSLSAGCAPLPAITIPDAPTHQALAAVFDIDGTLTPDVFAINEVRPGAAEAVRRYSDKGYKVIYLSARISFLQGGIPDWLKRNGFPEGELQLPQTFADRHDPAAYKERVLKGYAAHGWRLAVAYGDSSTDFQAYGNAGIPRKQVYALLRRGDDSCQPGVWNACLDGWEGLLGLIAGLRH